MTSGKRQTCRCSRNNFLLQDNVPPESWEKIRISIEAELGGTLEDLFGTFDPIPVAAASLAQVHAAILPDGQEVVVKVQRPGIAETIRADLQLLLWLTQKLDERIPSKVRRAPFDGLTKLQNPQSFMFPGYW